MLATENVTLKFRSSLNPSLNPSHSLFKSLSPTILIIYLFFWHKFVGEKFSLAQNSAGAFHAESKFGLSRLLSVFVPGWKTLMIFLLAAKKWKFVKLCKCSENSENTENTEYYKVFLDNFELGVDCEGSHFFNIHFPFFRIFLFGRLSGFSAKTSNFWQFVGEQYLPKVLCISQQISLKEGNSKGRN